MPSIAYSKCDNRHIIGKSECVIHDVGWMKGAYHKRARKNSSLARVSRVGRIKMNLFKNKMGQINLRQEYSQQD